MDKSPFSANQPYDDRIKLLGLYDDLDRTGRQELLQYAAELLRKLNARSPATYRNIE